MPSFTPLSTHRFASDTDAPAATCGVYVIEHLPTGRVYVGHVGGGSGRGFAKRCQEHVYNAANAKSQHRRSRFGNFVRKYGPGGFVFHVVEIIDAAAPNQSFESAEQALIDRLDAAGAGGLNTHAHATTPRGVKRSEEARRNMSESRKRALCENPRLLASLRERLVSANRSSGKRAELQTRNSDPSFQSRRAAGAQAMHADPQRNSAKRERMSRAWTEEMREQQRRRAAERMADPDRRAAISKPVMCVGTGVVYPSRAAAARAFGLTKQSMMAHMAGRRPTFAGHKWVEVEVPQ